MNLPFFPFEVPMKADALPIGSLLAEKRCFDVPIYQRTYSWTKDKQLERFFDHVAEKAEARLAGYRSGVAHYMGALILQPDGNFSVARVTTLLVVDGQQRLTTFQVFLAAASQVARDLDSPDLGTAMRAYVLNEGERHMADPKRERYKLHPTGYDRALFRDLIDKSIDELRAAHHGTKHHLLEAYLYFYGRIKEFSRDEASDATDQRERLKALFTTLLEDFRLVVITLEDKDDAQVIFETLNATGEPLSAMDLVRNDIFYRAARTRGSERAEELLTTQWSIFEDPFWKELGTVGRIKKPRMDLFLWHTLSAETGKEVSLSDLYGDYRRLTRSGAFADVEAELAVLARHAPHYRTLVTPQGESALARIARRLGAWEVTTAYPLILTIAADTSADEATKDQIYQLIYSYIVRRAFCWLTAKNYNEIFLRATVAVKERGVSLPALETFFAGLRKDTNRFPDDDEFRSGIVTKAAYGAIKASRLGSLLRELELAARDRFDEGVSLSEQLTIEHILPDAWRDHWPLQDGTSAPKDEKEPVSEIVRAMITRRDQAKHLLGNLTLLTPAANSSYSNAPFQDGSDTCKQARLKQSLLRLNHEVAQHLTWGEEEIHDRGVRLATLAIRVWPAPAPHDFGAIPG